MKTLLLASNPPAMPDGGDAPRIDFVELARMLGGELSFPPEKSGVWGKLERATASDIRQARLARKRTDVSRYLSLSEKVGLPLALMGTKGRRHVLIGHHLTSERKASLQRKQGWLNRFDAVVVLCPEQESYLLDEAKLPRERVFFVRDKVDSRFFQPQSEILVESDLIVAVGRERRDYKSLVEAMKLLPEKRAAIVASSPWARQEATGEGANVPSNVEFVRGLSFVELRELYAKASVVCVPLEMGTRYAAGVNGLLEAMAMAKPIVVTKTPGLNGYLEPSAVVTVPPGDVDTLANALRLAPNPRLGAAGRKLVDGGWNLDSYLDAIREIVCR